MTYSTSKEFADKIYSLYLYGEESLPDEIMKDKYLKGARPDPAPIEIEMSDFMAGPGRFMKMAYFELVQKFLDYTRDLSISGEEGVNYTLENGKIVYTKDQMSEKLNVDNRRYSFNQAFFDDGSGDY